MALTLGTAETRYGRSKGEALKPDFKYDGPGPGKGGTGVLSVDGRELDTKTIKHTIPLLMSIDETFTGAINKLTSLCSSSAKPRKCLAQRSTGCEY